MLHQLKQSRKLEVSLHGTLFKFLPHPTLPAFLAIGNDHDLSVWHLQSLELLYKKEGVDSPIADALVSTDGRLHVIASVNGTLTLYNDHSPGEEPKKLTAQLPQKPLCLHLHGDQLHVGTTSNQVFVFDINNLQLVQEVQTTSWITQIASLNGKPCYMGKLLDALDIGHKGLIMHHHIAFDRLATGDSSGLLVVSDVHTLEPLYSYQFPSAIVQIQFIDQRTLIAGTFDPGVLILQDGKPLQQIKDRAAPLLLTGLQLISRSSVLTRHAHSDWYE